MAYKGSVGTSMHVTYLGPKKKNRKNRSKKQNPYTKAGPVTIIQPDGSSETKPAYNRLQFGMAAKGRKIKKPG